MMNKKEKACRSDKPGAVVMRLVSWLKYMFFPTYRRSRLIIKYLRQGYNTQEAMIKVGAIKA